MPFKLRSPVARRASSFWNIESRERVSEPQPSFSGLVRPDASPLADENAGPEASVSLAKT